MSTLDTRKAPNEGVFQNDEENGEEQIITDSVDVQQTNLSIRIGDLTEPFVYIYQASPACCSCRKFRGMDRDPPSSDSFVIDPVLYALLIDQLEPIGREIDHIIRRRWQQFALFLAYIFGCAAAVFGPMIYYNLFPENVLLLYLVIIPVACLIVIPPARFLNRLVFQSRTVLLAKDAMLVEIVNGMDESFQFRGVSLLVFRHIERSIRSQGQLADRSYSRILMFSPVRGDTEERLEVS